MAFVWQALSSYWWGGEERGYLAEVSWLVGAAGCCGYVVYQSAGGWVGGGGGVRVVFGLVCARVYYVRVCVHTYFHVRICALLLLPIYCVRRPPLSPPPFLSSIHPPTPTPPLPHPLPPKTHTGIRRRHRAGRRRGGGRGGG